MERVRKIRELTKKCVYLQEQLIKNDKKQSNNQKNKTIVQKHKR